MEKVLKNLKMETVMMDNFYLENFMDEESSYGQMDNNMKGNEEITQKKVLEPLSDLMEQYIKGCLLMVREMEKELISMLI